MLFSSDEDVIKECKRLGASGVLGKLKIIGYFGDKRNVAYEWMLKQLSIEEAKRHSQIVRSSQWTAGASWVLAVITTFALGFQIHDSREQHKNLKSQIDQQLKATEIRQKQASSLLAVQILLQYDKRFDSLEMRKARRRLAFQLLHNQYVTEDRVPDFFDTLAMYTHKDMVDKDSVYNSYSYYIERYWAALKSGYIDKFRKEEGDTSGGYFADFEELNKEMLSADADADNLSVDREGPSKSEVRRFLEEEAALPF